MNQSLIASDVSVAYDTADGRLTACTDIHLEVRAGECVTIIGPSGCGKSTLLHCLGGLIAPSAGTVHQGDALLREPDPHQAAFVFQDYSLFPWKTILDNVAIVLRFQGTSKKEARERARTQLAFVGLGDFADAYPAQLSGGMQQRVALARALVMQPRTLLMDEPFGALDEQTRRTLGRDISQILYETGQGVVLITHSLEEAIYWADRIVIMSPRPGTIKEIISVDAPRPRGLDFLTSDRFQELRVHLFDQIENPGIK
ncbi:ABC transporter ATP-binding protein [Microbacterium sp. NPDC058342]|uniref:ABC transporter ATP-binding protein n=1 Tax=Microbacterium sp. NPDC058342 TaxID=3346454 RepID=UPI00365D1FB7